MTSQVQMAFLSVLLGLVMFFAYQSLRAGDTVLSVRTGAGCPDSGICEPLCGNVAIEIQSYGTISFRDTVYPPAVFIDRLPQLGLKCAIPLKVITVFADPDMPNGDVVRLSNQMMKAVPGIQVNWWKKAHTF